MRVCVSIKKTDLDLSSLLIRHTHTHTEKKMSDYDNDDDDDEEAATSSQLSKTPLPQQQPAPVDLRLAKTYLPGFMCLGRGTVIILIISRSPLSVPLILALATAMYVDRSIRTESIFDSNAMLGAIIASHALNVMRSDPEIHQVIWVLHCVFFSINWETWFHFVLFTF